jgi:hypothetical protein
MIFLNEHCKLIKTIDIQAIRLVNFVYFDDLHEKNEDDRLICAGIDGTFMFDFVYQGKYNPKLAAQIGQWQHIKIELHNKQPIRRFFPWVKGMRVDEQNKIIITWTQNLVSFNQLRGRKSVAEGIQSALCVTAGDLIV